VEWDSSKPEVSGVVSETEGVLRLVVTFGLTFVLGFERQLRGSPAGNRTFSLIGLGAAVIGLLSESAAPNALAGAVTGIGFIGAGLVFRQRRPREVVRGVTTAATVLVLVSLERPHVPGLRLLDAARYESRFAPDNPTPQRPADTTPQQ
jgi:putative Mg2+ transporter-C (MgtC) family protein